MDLSGTSCARPTGLPILSLQRLSAAYFSLLAVGAAWHTLAVLR